MTYNSTGKRITSENLAGQITTTAWDCCHKISEVQPDGSTTKWDYDDEGRMVASSRLIPLDMTNVTWLTTCYEYDDLGRQIATWQTNRTAMVGLPATRTRYDALGRVVARVDQLGNITTTSYSEDGRTISVQNPNTSTRIITRSADGEMLSITGTAVTPEFHTYGILPDGTRWSKTVQGETASAPRFTKRYENLLDQTIREERSGFQGAVLATTHAYDSLGRLVSTTADYEPVVEFTYDTFGNRIATTRTVGRAILGAPQGGPASVPTETEWRRSEVRSLFIMHDGDIWLTQTNIVSCSDANIAPLITSSSRQLTGLTQTLPARSRPIDVRGNATVNELLVDSPFVTSRQTVPYATNKHQTTSRYGVSLMDVSVSAVTNTVAYDALGRAISNTDGRGNTRHTEYNSFGQRSASIDALGNRTTYKYDQFGNLASVINPLGNAIVYEYDLSGNKTYEGGATYPVRYTYDTQNRRTSLATTRDGTTWDVTRWVYSAATGLCTSKIYADGSTVVYTYTPDGLALRTTYSSGRWTENVYNEWREVIATLNNDDTENILYMKDEFGRVTSEINNVASVQYSLADTGLATNEIWMVSGSMATVTRSLDGQGRILFNNGMHFIYADDGKLICLSNELARVEYSYSPDRLDIGYTVTLANGRTFSRNTVRDTYRRGLLMNIASAMNDSLIEGLSYGYDALNRSIVRNSDAFGYNERSEVTGAIVSGVTAEYAYDDIGNSTSFTANSLNQYSRFQYDLDGNLLSDGVYAFAYDSFGRLKTVSSNGVLLVTNHYDAQSRRVKKVTPASTTTFFYDDWNLIEERIACTNGTTSTIKYYWGKDLSGELQGAGGVGGLLYQSVDDAIYIPCCDNKGNITKYVDSIGNIVASYTYDAFGKLISKSDALADLFRHRFSTKYFDVETGLYYYGYRFYHPALMRWLNRDPIEERGGLNLYGFCGNNGLGVFDSNGLYSYNIFNLLKDAMCDDAYRFAMSKMNTSEERNAWNRYTRHDGMRSDPNIYLTAEEVKTIAESNNKVVEYVKNKRSECAEGKTFAVSTSIGGNAPSPWRLAIGGVSIGITANCNGNCFSYSYKINDLYDFDIKGFPGFTSRSIKGEIFTILVRTTEVCLECDWEQFYHRGIYNGK